MIAALGLGMGLVGAAAPSIAAGMQRPTAGAQSLWNMATIGLCQCVADRSSLHLFCTAGPDRCEASCGSRKFAFVPLIGDVLKRCSPSEVYVVLPNADGHPGSGAISVNHGQTKGLLDRAYAGAALVHGSAGGAPIRATDVEDVFGAAIKARPVLPKRFQLFFQPGSTRIEPQSESELHAIAGYAKQQARYHVAVIGHTGNAVGEHRRGADLSLQRAVAVRAALVRDGIEARTISAVGRGDREPLAVTAGHAAEGRDSRVEVVVR
jgi:outer membrane protein OmpA-like peptidoglycan-associated protein